MAADMPVLQDWSPLQACLTKQLEQLAFQRLGLPTFRPDDHRDADQHGSVAAHRNAEILFAHCEELSATDDLEPDIIALDIAIGRGLHVLQLLDRFESLCTGAGRDYYGRLTLFACADNAATLADARNHGIFDRHPQRVVLGLVDPLDPARLLRLDTGEAIDLTGRLRAVFHNCSLSKLPANLFRRSSAVDPNSQIAADQWSCVIQRTILRFPQELGRFTALTVQELQAMAQSDETARQRVFAPLFALMDVELALGAVEITQLPEGADLVGIAQRIVNDLAVVPRQTPEGAAPVAGGEAPNDIWVLHSAAVLHCLEKTLEILRPDGYFWYCDYGPVTAATAGGLNHSALDSWLTSQDNTGNPRSGLSTPRGEGEGMIHHRLASRAAIPVTRNAFEAQFDGAAAAKLAQLLDIARNAVAPSADRMQTYRQILLAQPENWALLAEAGEIAVRQANNAELGHLLLTEALRIQPWHAAAWNTLGDLYRVMQDLDPAQRAYEQAVRVNPEHYRGYLNLAVVHGLRCDFARAVEFAALSIARDTQGHDFERSKAVFDELLARLLAQRQVAIRSMQDRDDDPER